MSASSKIDLVAGKAQELASHSWEYGVISEALIELYNPDLSVFSQVDILTSGYNAVTGLDYAKKYISTDQEILIDGEGSSGDSASLGTAALLLGLQDPMYTKAAQRQKDTLVHNTLKWENGAISHRVKVAAVWADFVYVAIPFIAFYGYVRGEEMMLNEAVRQCKLYHEALRDPGTGLWKHVLGLEWEDLKCWSTGNGWVLAGMTRVLAILKIYCQSSADGIEELKDGQAWLQSAISEHVEAIVKLELDENGLLRNYLDDETYPGESAGTALVVSTIYRMAVLCPNSMSEDAISWAGARYGTVWSNIGEDGLLSPVVNPMDSHQREPIKGSPEGQAFGIFMYTAHRDWKQKKIGGD